VWPLDLSVITESTKEPLHLEVRQKEAIVKIPLKGDEWLKINGKQAGVYRVAYSPLLSARLGVALQKKQLAAVDRLGMQADAFALAKSGAIPLSQVLELVAHYKEETDYTVWFNLSGNLVDVMPLLAETDAAAAFDRFLVELFTGAAAKVGWEPKDGEGDLIRQLRALVLNRLIAAGDAKTSQEALDRYGKLRQDRAAVPLDLQHLCFRAAMRQHPATAFDEIVAMYKAAKGPEERLKALAGVAYGVEPEAIKRAIAFSLTAEVRSQDMHYIFLTLVQSKAGREMAWAALGSQWDEFKAKLEGAGMVFGAVLQALIKDGVTEKFASEVKTFFETHKAEHVERHITQGLEAVQANVAGLARVKGDADKWLLAKFK